MKARKPGEAAAPPQKQPAKGAACFLLRVRSAPRAGQGFSQQTDGVPEGWSLCVLMAVRVWALLNVQPGQLLPGDRLLRLWWLRQPCGLAGWGPFAVEVLVWLKNKDSVFVE